MGDVSSPVNFPIVDTYSNAADYNQARSGSPSFPTSSAFFNINNGMAISAPSEHSTISRPDTDNISGNTPMSPRAGALLPSDLLGDEEQSLVPDSTAHFPSLGPSAASFDNFLPGSPSRSSGSRPTSAFASPRESMNNLREHDRPSTNMSKAPFTQSPSDNVQSASRRLSGLFGFHRQRGKTMIDGPLLGTLKPGQSQSFPLNQEQGLDPIGTRRRRLSYSGNWANPVTTLFPRNSTGSTSADSSSDHMVSSRRAMFPFFTSGKDKPRERSDLATGYNQFSPRHDPIDPTILGAVRRDSLSPRPSSTYSFENHLPRPTSDNQPFGWPAPEKAGQRGSPLGFDWSSPVAWSRSQSRRPSLQFGSSNHLPLGMQQSEMDFLDNPYEVQRPIQAPIGTRPPSSHRPVTPKLNPTAPSFKTLFGKKPEKDKKDTDPTKPSELDQNLEDLSPPGSRWSNTSRSIRTSAAESYESLDRMPSSTPSDSANPKESFIQKIARKGSSNKFNIPWKERGGLFSKKADNSSNQGDFDDDAAAASEAQLGKSVDSVASSTPSADKSGKSSLGFSFMRKAKKAEKSTSESSEKASETGDEESNNEGN